MRVTQGMLSNNMLRNLSQSNAALGKYMDQLTTGKKINRPSDDPVTAMNGMGYRTEVVKVEQFQRNTNEAYNWFENTDAALSQATSALQRISDLTKQASNDTYDADQRKNIATEIEQIKQDLIDIANTKVNDKYIFNGTNTSIPPFDKEGVLSITDGDIKPVKIEVATGTYLQTNTDPFEAFGEMTENGDTTKLFSDIDKLIGALNEDNQEGISEAISDMEVNFDSLVNTRADLGARMNRLELIENRLGDQEIAAIDTMSKNEDIDYAKVITQLITQESLHRAALSTSSKIIQPTLVDFLR
ncbi:flagellar hook-associated protein FlgL [Oceanobacillus bengalensis]|uniref:Flagellar hook-associated protein FlgL n=1 Tax=Oceanobacillus bengalensis TaxID=1435466 RepID=A0A494Z6X2_9BACI|nr:flagellar hook-associated protein FlgL [Oceanobacillus bengalensis]RKQ18320.1 flagellar hook-associated protein FlgL [Oceanobacillus bengalensis]